MQAAVVMPVRPVSTVVPTPVDRGRPDKCGRCGYDHLDDDRYCCVCGAVTLNPDGYVAAFATAS